MWYKTIFYTTHAENKFMSTNLSVKMSEEKKDELVSKILEIIVENCLSVYEEKEVLDFISQCLEYRSLVVKEYPLFRRST